MTSTNGESIYLDSARTPERPDGIYPNLSVEVEPMDGNRSSTITAFAKVTEGSAPIYYTQGAGKNGIYKNSYVLWELYGPEEEDYTDFWNDRWNVSVTENENSVSAEIKFNIQQKHAIF